MKRQNIEPVPDWQKIKQRVMREHDRKSKINRQKEWGDDYWAVEQNKTADPTTGSTDAGVTGGGGDVEAE